MTDTAALELPSVAGDLAHLAEYAERISYVSSYVALIDSMPEATQEVYQGVRAQFIDSLSTLALLVEIIGKRLAGNLYG